MKQLIPNILISTAIGLIFTFVNFSNKVQATDPTILDVSSVSGSVITIGDTNTNIKLNTSTGVIELTGKSFYVNGDGSTNGNMNDIILNGSYVGIGDVNSNGNEVSILVKDETESIVASVAISEP
jgi:hypothetical protein